MGGNRETYYRETLDREETAALRARLPVSAHDALTGYCKAATDPGALVATILAEGPDTGTNAAAGKTWDVIGQALLEMRAAGKPFTALIFRSFVGRLLQRPPPNDSVKPGDRMRALAAKLKAQDAPP